MSSRTWVTFPPPGSEHGKRGSAYAIDGTSAATSQTGRCGLSQDRALFRRPIKTDDLPPLQSLPSCLTQDRQAFWTRQFAAIWGSPSGSTQGVLGDEAATGGGHPAIVQSVGDTTWSARCLRRRCRRTQVFHHNRNQLYALQEAQRRNDQPKAFLPPRGIGDGQRAFGFRQPAPASTAHRPRVAAIPRLPPLTGIPPPHICRCSQARLGVGRRCGRGGRFSAAIGDGVVYFGTAAAVDRRRPTDLNCAGAKAGERIGESSPAVATSASSICDLMAACTRCTLRCNRPLRSRPTWSSSPVIFGNLLLIGSDDGNLYGSSRPGNRWDL